MERFDLMLEAHKEILRAVAEGCASMARSVVVRSDFDVLDGTMRALNELLDYANPVQLELESFAERAGEQMTDFQRRELRAAREVIADLPTLIGDIRALIDTERNKRDKDAE